MSALAESAYPLESPRPHSAWSEIDVAAPELAATMRRYLERLGETVVPYSVIVSRRILLEFAGWLAQADPSCRHAADVRASHLADYAAWLSTRTADGHSKPPSPNTIRTYLNGLHRFFSNIMSWGFVDAPATTPLDRSLMPAAVPPAPRVPKRTAPPPRQPIDRRVYTWAQIDAQAPQLASTMAAYLAQIAVSSRPGTVSGADLALRVFAEHVIKTDPECVCVADVTRRHIESFKLALAARPGMDPDKKTSVATVRNKLGLVRTFLERIIDWDYEDAPRRVPIFAGDFPKADEPLPRFLDDPTATKFMATLEQDTNRRRRLMVELLARTGMRVGELGALRDDAVFRRSDTFWLRIPIGKLHNDRNVPLHPVLVELIDDYRAWRGPSPSGLLVVRDDGRAFDRRTIHRYVAAVARRAGTGHVHPHQLRHTLATQLINRGMSLEAIAELLGHRSPRMTLVYARISNDLVAQQYFRAMQAVESVGIAAVPDAEARMFAQGHRRLLGNGHCARPAQLDCSYQTMCEGCGFFETGPEFLTILRRQKDNATDQADFERAHVFKELIEGMTTDNPLGTNIPPALPIHLHDDRG
jgi:integrase